MEEEIKEVCQEQQEEEVVRNVISSSPLQRPFFNPFPQSLLLSQYSPSLVALIAVNVWTCAAISNDEPPPFPSSAPPNVTKEIGANDDGQPMCGNTTLTTASIGACFQDTSVNVHSSPCHNSSTLGISCSCNGAPLASCWWCLALQCPLQLDRCMGWH